MRIGKYKIGVPLLRCIGILRSGCPRHIEKLEDSVVLHVDDDGIIVMGLGLWIYIL